MKHKKLEVHYTEYSQLEDLDSDMREMVNLAKEAASTAYAPYSLYKVGAAVKMTNGVVVKGSNQENVAYPSGLCAERVALYAASSQFPKEDVVSLSITTEHEFSTEGELFSPCGACRQVMAETEVKSGKKIDIIVHSPDGITRVFKGIGQLLPFSFHNAGLNKMKK